MTHVPFNNLLRWITHAAAGATCNFPGIWKDHARAYLHGRQRTLFLGGKKSKAMQLSHAVVFSPLLHRLIWSVVGNILLLIHFMACWLLFACLQQVHRTQKWPLTSDLFITYIHCVFYGKLEYRFRTDPHKPLFHWKPVYTRAFDGTGLLTAWNWHFTVSYM